MKGRSLGLVMPGFFVHRSRVPIRCRAHVVFQLHFRDYSLPFTPIVLLACIHVASCSRPAPLHLLSVMSSSAHAASLRYLVSRFVVLEYPFTLAPRTPVSSH